MFAPVRVAQRVALAAALALLAGAAEAQQKPGGVEVWAANCGLCHRSRAVGAYDARRWEIVVSHMALVAGLTPDEEGAVREFLVGSARAREAGTAGTSATAANLSAPVRLTGMSLTRQPAEACCNSAVGRSLFEAKCAPCHGKGGKGDGPVAGALKPRPPDLTTTRLRTMSDDTLAQILVKGGKGMPAFEKLLKPDEVLELVNYIRTLQP